MKKFLSLIAVSVILMASMAYALPGAGSITNAAGAYVTQIFTNQNATVASAAQKVDRNTIKTFIFTNMSGNGTALAIVPGTEVVQCGPTSTGPWVTAKTQADTSMSTTTATIFTMNDFCQWVRVNWTRTGTGTSTISTWLLYGN